MNLVIWTIAKDYHSKCSCVRAIDLINFALRVLFFQMSLDRLWVGFWHTILFDFGNVKIAVRGCILRLSSLNVSCRVVVRIEPQM